MPFDSVNVLEDASGMADLRALGARMVPVVSRGRAWVDGQALKALATFVGVAWQHRMLPPSVLAERIDAILEAAARMSGQLPAERVSAMLPNGFRSYASLCAHIAQIVDAFVQHMEEGRPLVESDYLQPVPAELDSPERLASYIGRLQGRFVAWWAAHGATTDFSRSATVYYGEQSLHEFLERSAWHAAQHTRQLALLLRTMGVIPDRPLGPAQLDGLPLPENEWDDKPPTSG